MPDVDEILLDVDDRMTKALQAYQQSLATVRTGRAHTSLVEHLQVEHYGQKMALNQLATIAAPDAQLLTVQAWDQGAVDPIMKAIQSSELGINPSNDGALIRLPIPPLTEERRRELVKTVGTRTEDAKVSVRNARRHGMDELKQALREHDLSEDDERRAESEIEKLTTGYVEKLDRFSKEKEQELLEV
jgi:ribosome recycling factor